MHLPVRCQQIGQFALIAHPPRQTISKWREIARTYQFACKKRTSEGGSGPSSVVHLWLRLDQVVLRLRTDYRRLAGSIANIRQFITRTISYIFCEPSTLFSRAKRFYERRWFIQAFGKNLAQNWHYLTISSYTRWNLENLLQQHIIFSFKRLQKYANF